MSEVCVQRTATQLIITNNTGKDIYYTAFDETVLPLIDWGPFCSNNVVSHNSSIRIDVTNITTTSSHAVAFFWWSCKNGTAETEIKTLVVNAFETKCR